MDIFSFRRQGGIIKNISSSLRAYLLERCGERKEERPHSGTDGVSGFHSGREVELCIRLTS